MPSLYHYFSTSYNLADAGCKDVLELKIMRIPIINTTQKNWVCMFHIKKLFNALKFINFAFVNWSF